ncbi:MAG: diadenylate cyclase [Pirellulaceae bacterium]
MAKSESIVILSPCVKDEDKAPKNFYLWGYQPHFASTMKSVANQLFSKLDDSIVPDAFLIAINADKAEKHPIAVVEPPDHDFEAVDFERVLDLADELSNAAAGVQYGFHAEDQKIGEAWVNRELRRDFRANVRRSVQRTIEGACVHDKHIVYVSAAREVGPYFVFSVLMLQAHDYNSHPRLRITQRDQYSVVPSLLDAAALSFLTACYDAILKSLDGDSFVQFPDTDTMLRSAGHTFMYTPTGVCNEFNGLHGGFATCNEVSTLTYERGVGSGRILLARTDHDNLSESISFQNPPKLDNFRAVRKLLELAGDEEALISNSDVVTALGKIVGNYDTSKEDLFVIEFVGHAKWQLVHGGIVLMRVEHGIPQLPKVERQITRFNETFERLFPDSTARQRQVIKGIVRKATNLHHGTIIVISDQAESEAVRLGSQATSIEPVRLTDNLIDKASQIDGAILVSPDGICHAIGAILDGVANCKGNSERGSRYNSTVRYVYASQCACIGLVVSDDGMVDSVPEYRPRISRRELDSRIERLANTFSAGNSDESESHTSNFDENEFCECMAWIRAHSFYLSDAQCEKVNALNAEYQALPLGSGFRQIYSDLVPNADMDESYFRQ